MITIFTIPKAFIGHIDIIQNNAIQSWLKLEPKCEIILCGDEQGVAETAAFYGVQHLPYLEKNSYGTPLVRSAFESVERVAANPILCYVNADIIFLQSLIDSVKLITFKYFLMIGQRWNLDIFVPIDFSHLGWEEPLIEGINNKGNLLTPYGCDFFIFPKEAKWDFPDFVVGRPGWDNWLIYRARSLQMPVIDITNATLVIHQNHDYSHVPGRFNNDTFNGPEADINRTFLEGHKYYFSVKDATHLLSGDSIIRAESYDYLKYRISHQSSLVPSKGLISNVIWKIMLGIVSYPQLFPEQIWKSLLYKLTK